MAPLLVKLGLAPALIVAATLAARRWGPRAGGVVAAFPAIVGPLLLVTVLQHGLHAATEAADGTLLGLVGLAAFAVLYAETACRHRRWPSSLIAGWVAAALSTSVAGIWLHGIGAASGLVATLALLSAAFLLMRRGPGDGAALPLSGPGTVTLRAVTTALLVTGLAWAVGHLGPLAGGVLAALPLLASLLAVFTHREAGPDAAVEVLRGTVFGMTGFVVFCQIVAVTVVPYGPAMAFALATSAALLAQAAMTRYASARNSAGRSGEASASARVSPSAS